MANRKKFIKSSSGYVRKSLHQLTSNGNIYEQDFMTINEMPTFAPGQIPVYGDSNFIFTIRKLTNGQYNVTNGAWVQPEEDNDFWTSNDLGLITKTNDSEYIKPYYASITDFAYYGSAMELIRSTINSIIRKFPAGVYITDNNYLNYTDENGNSIEGINGTLYAVENPFMINLNAEASSVSDNPYKFLCNKYTEFIVCDANEAQSSQDPITGWEVKRYCPICGAEIQDSKCTSNNTHNIYYCYENGRPVQRILLSTQSGDVIPITYYQIDDEILPTGIYKDRNKIIRPNDEVLQQFYNGLSDFEKVILNKDTFPRYKSSFDTYFEDDKGRIRWERKNYIWPVSKDNYNLEISDARYKEYLESLTEMALFYDNFWCDNYYRIMAHESVKNMDWTFSRFSADETIDNDDIDFSRMEMYMRIYGRQLDEIKRYIDGIGFINNITYNQENNPTDYVLSDSLELAGWEVKNLFIKDNGDVSNKLYDGESGGYTISEANNEFLRRLRLNSSYVFSQKGTKKALRTLLSLFGMKESMSFLTENSDESLLSESDFSIIEHIYEVEKAIDTRDVDVIAYNKAKNSFDITYQSAYGDLSGIPVKDILIKEEDYTLIVPWFDRDKNYDTPLHFEMAGGWDGRKDLTVPNLNGNLCRIEVEADEGAIIQPSLFKDTQKYVKYVNDVDELLCLPNNSIKGSEYVYVFNIENNAINSEIASHYFYLHQPKHAYSIDNQWDSSKQELDELTGWYSIPLKEVNNDNVIGRNLLYYLSLKEDTLGNNPHFGNKKYDGGKSWIDSLSFPFKNSIEKLGSFIGVNKYTEEEINENVHFNIKDTETNSKTFNYINKETEIENELKSALTLNTKRLELRFYLDINKPFNRRFIEDYVLFYLKQIIPSTTIFTVTYIGNDGTENMLRIVYGVENK
jgi:hypothetical protein